MADLDTRFQAASKEVTELPKRPGQVALLRLYAYYKQATEGDVTGERPGMTSFRERAKFDSWKAIDGMSQDDAKTKYIETVENLKAEQGA